jgi:hypothetical protein
VRDWFDEVYATRALAYLRPPDAYPIFVQLLDHAAGQRLLDIACGPACCCARRASARCTRPASTSRR